MNKKLLALAIGAAVAMPVAALADGPTLYGKINLSLENETSNAGLPASVDNKTWKVNNNASRIGVKGTAETGVAGVSGLYNAEFGVDADDGDNSAIGGADKVLTGRNIFIGVTGDFGTVLVGNVDSPTKSIQGKVDQFNDTAADMAFSVVSETRAPNAVAYASPKLADSVVITVASWQGEGAAPFNAAPNVYDGVLESFSSSIAYNSGALSLGLGLDMEVPTLNGVGMIAPLDVLNTTRLVGSYSTDSLTLGALYQMSEQANVAVNPAENTSLLVSGAVKSGDWTFKLQYTTTDSDAGAASVTVDGLALGADYALGKSTTVGAIIANANTDANAAAGGADPEMSTYGVYLQQAF